MLERRYPLLVPTGLLLVVVVFWGFFLESRGWTGTEARRAVIAREMFRTSDFVVPRHGGEVTLAKPPLHYQLQAVSMALFGEGHFAARFPSLLLMSLLVAVVYLASLSFGRRPAPRYALATALLFASSPVLFQFGTSAEIDGGFAVWIALSLFALSQACVATKPPAWFFLSGLCTGLGLLTKGPPLLLFLVPAWIPLLRRGAWKGLGLWLVPSLLPGGIWVLLLKASGAMSGSKQAAVAESESLGRMSYYKWGDLLEIPGDMLKVLVVLLPVAVLLPYAWRHWRHAAKSFDEKQILAHKVLLYSSIGSLIAFWFFPHRATRYLLPALPPLLFLLVHRSGDFLAAPPERLVRSMRVLCVLFLLALLPFVFSAPPWLFAGVPAVLAMALIVPRVRLLPGLIVAGVATQLVLGIDINRRDSLPPRQSSPFAATLARHCGSEDILSWGHVPSELIWQLGAQLSMDEAMKSDLRARDEPWIIWEALPQRAGDFLPVAADVHARISIDDKDLVLAKRRQ